MRGRIQRIVYHSIFYLFIMVMTFTMKAYFRSITSAFKSPAPAQSTAGLIFLMLTFYTGYSLPKQTMIGALKWLTFINVRIDFTLRAMKTLTH